ncbi:MAG: sigma-70 family RNA polymerase sigma factor [Dokdonella sp.]
MPDPTTEIQQRLEQILRDYGTRLRYLLRSHKLDQRGIDPDDVEQEVRIRLWRAIERDRFGDFHASYIQRAVASAVIDALRRAEVRAADPLPDDLVEGSPLPDTGPGPERKANDGERMRGLQHCLAQLPERRRLPIVLHLEGFSLQEIADRIGTSAEASRKLVTRGLEELKDRLREQGFGTFDD